MKLGLTITSQHLPGEPLDRKLAETIEQVRLAREVGFDLIAVPQHFLTTEFQMLQPSVIAEQDVSDVGEGRDQAVERVPRLLGPDAEVLELLDQELVETPCAFAWLICSLVIESVRASRAFRSMVSHRGERPEE
jgi:hypothetical protein